MGIDFVIEARARSIGNLPIRRILPYAIKRMVGPVVFLDHMGPSEFPEGEGMDVRPHPHIGLATVTYLFEGVIHHQDSLGVQQDIEPGAINWMVAGRGIVHSERTPERLRTTGSQVHGVQIWVALPEELEEIDPSFTHHPKESLPEFEKDGITYKLLLGEAYGFKSPVPVHSPMFYLEAFVPTGKTITFPEGYEEAALYVIDGEFTTTSEQRVGSSTMVISSQYKEVDFTATEDSHVLLIGGDSVGERKIYWNFVSSSEARINEAKAEWEAGPFLSRFKAIPTDNKEYIPLPDQGPLNPKGTIL